MKLRLRLRTITASLIIFTVGMILLPMIGYTGPYVILGVITVTTLVAIYSEVR